MKREGDMSVQVGFSRLATVVGIVCGVIGVAGSVNALSNLVDQKKRSERWETARLSIAPHTWKGIYAACDDMGYTKCHDVGFVVRDDQTTYTTNLRKGLPDDPHMVAIVLWNVGNRLEVWHRQHGWTEERTAGPPSLLAFWAAATLPLFAFAVPYGLVRALGWIISGFQ
jgi:hypothetical protein